MEIAEFYWERRLVAVETRVLLGRTTCCCGDGSFTGQGDSLFWSFTGQDDLKGVSALQL